MKQWLYAALALLLLTVTVGVGGFVRPERLAGEFRSPRLAVMHRAEIPPAPPEPVVILAFGDIMLDRYVRTLMDRNGLDYPFRHFEALKTEMMAKVTPRTPLLPDLITANLEGPVSNTPYVNPGTAMVFNFKPDVLPILKKYGFNALNLANNHAYDMGAAASQETRPHLNEAGIPHFGDAKVINEHTVWTTTIKDTRLTFVGFNETLSDHIDREAAMNVIRAARENSDFVLVSIHWGVEYRTTPTQKQVELAHAMVDAGADAILGHHAHVIASSEWYKDRPIYYSLGNFVFDQYFQRSVQEGLGLTLTLTKAVDDAPPRILVEETVFDLFRSQPSVRTGEKMI